MLAAGTTLGPYKILAPLGAGGMGEVYRARDTRLGRDVALKVIHDDLSRDPERLKRFEQEARAAGALSHPNVCTIFDVGTHEGAPYVVMELLEGESLRARLAHGPLPVRRAIDHAVQIAHGLAVAHAKGIVHRDLKPENLFVTEDGRTKVLDFGLAKLTRPEAPDATGERTVSILSTESGAILGTAGYMAPEQVRGEAADPRSDLFALGAILYEMVTGRRAFRGATFVETGNAILNAEPDPLGSGDRPVPPGLEPIVRRCLEKSPPQRFQSASDLAFALEAVTAASGSSAPSTAGSPPRRPAWYVVLAGLAVAIAVTSLALLTSKQRELDGRATAVTYKRVTFQRGAVTAARFAPSGNAVLFTATWDGQPLDLFEIDLGAMYPRSLGVPRSHLLSVSRTGMAALSLDSDKFTWMGVERVGPLAELPLAGGTPHRLLKAVSAADWSPDGKALAFTRRVSGRSELQMPPGRTIYRSASAISKLKVAPSGTWMAFHEGPPGTAIGRVVIVDTGGKVLARSREVGAVMGLAWSAGGGELWYGVVPTEVFGDYTELRAISPGGRERVVQRLPGIFALHDIARDGRVLLAHSSTYFGIRGRRSPSDAELELGWSGRSRAVDISADGRTLLFVEATSGIEGVYVTYLRGTDGSSPVRIGEGEALSLSPDGERVLMLQKTVPHRLVILPVGAGDSISLKRGGMEQYGAAKWLPDGKGVVFFGGGASVPWRTYLQDVGGGLPRPITPEGVNATSVSPDGRYLAVGVSQRLRIFPIAGGSSRAIADLHRDEQVACWSGDGRAVVVGQLGTSLVLSRIDVSTGARTELRAFSVPDPAGVWVRTPMLAQAGQGYAYGYIRWLDALYVAEGLK